MDVNIEVKTSVEKDDPYRLSCSVCSVCKAENEWTAECESLERVRELIRDHLAQVHPEKVKQWNGI